MAVERSVVFTWNLGLVGCISLRWRGVRGYHIHKIIYGKRVWERNCRASGNEKDPYAVAVMRRSTIIGHVPRKNQQLARYFWQISCLLAISGRSETEKAGVSLRDPAHTHGAHTSWQNRNLIWLCIHNPPNCQIRFPTKFSGHTVFPFCV